jgi:hypothetical protein
MRNLPVVPPFFMLPPSSTAACFVPPVPLAEMVYAGGWMPRPHDCAATWLAITIACDVRFVSSPEELRRARSLGQATARMK